MNLPFPFRHIGIYGVGLLGGSLGLAIKQKCKDIENPDITITGIGRSEAKLQTAVDLHSIDEYYCDPSKLENGSLDLLILCTPVGLIPQNMRESLHAVKPGGVITDVGSTKSTLVSACENIAGSQCHFIGSHPMAGSHHSGVEAAIAELFDGKVCILTPTEQPDQSVLGQLTAFWQWLGMTTYTMSPQLHDQLTARSSHLPHLMSSILCKVAEGQGDDLVKILGEGFRDTTRTAAGDPTMWLNICLENREELVQSLHEMQQVIADLMLWMEQEDQDKLLTFFQQTQQWKLRSELRSEQGKE